MHDECGGTSRTCCPLRGHRLNDFLHASWPCISVRTQAHVLGTLATDSLVRPQEHAPLCQFGPDAASGCAGGEGGSGARGRAAGPTAAAAEPGCHQFRGCRWAAGLQPARPRPLVAGTASKEPHDMAWACAATPCKVGKESFAWQQAMRVHCARGALQPMTPH